MAVRAKKKSSRSTRSYLSRIRSFAGQGTSPSGAGQPRDPLFGFLANRIGIDLGTATTVAHVDGKGVVLREPTLVAINKRTNQVVAIGRKARVMFGRTPGHIEVVQPVQRGVICDYEVTEQLFGHVFRRAQDVSPKILGPVVVVGIPCRTSPMAIHAVRDAVIDAGARRAHVVHEPFAAAVGMGLPLQRESAVMVIDVGGGTSDVMILAGGEVVSSDSIDVAGDTFDRAIAAGLRDRNHLIIGPRTAEDLKVATMQSTKDRAVFNVQGRNAVDGLPLETEVSLEEILDLIAPCLQKIAHHIKEFVERSSPEVLADLKNNNIYFVGGGPAVRTFSRTIEDTLSLGVIVPDNPMTVVSRGTALISRNPGVYSKYFLA